MPTCKHDFRALCGADYVGKRLNVESAEDDCVAVCANRFDDPGADCRRIVFAVDQMDRPAKFQRCRVKAAIGGGNPAVAQILRNEGDGL